MSVSVVLIHPAFKRDDELVAVEEGNVDTAGYRTIAQLVDSFKQAGIQLEVFRAAEFDGDLEVNPLHRVYIDPVDRDRAIADALERGKKAMQEYEDLRRQAIDKNQKDLDNKIAEVAERLRRNREASQSVSSEAVPPADE